MGIHYLLLQECRKYMIVQSYLHNFLVLHQLMEIRRSDRLYQIQRYELFPNPDILVQIENRYGETVTLQDIFGKEENEKGEKSANNAAAIGSPPDTQVDTSEGIIEVKKKKVSDKLKADTDSKNPEYLVFLKNRKEKDYLSEQQTLLKTAKEEAAIM